MGGDTGARGLCGDVTGRKSGLKGGDMARWMGEGGAREKGDTRGELRGEDAALSSALEKMKAVSVRLRWYLLKGLPGGKVLEEFRKRNPNFTSAPSRTSFYLNALVWTFEYIHTVRTGAGSRAGGAQ